MRALVTASLVAAMVLAQVPSSLWPSLAPTVALAADPVIDQRQDLVEQSVVVDIVANGQELAQTATVGISGRFAGFQVPITCPDQATLQFSIRQSAIDGSPGGNSINGVAASGTIVKGTPTTWWGWNFSQTGAQYNVQAGDRITLHARVTFGGPCQWYHGPNGDPYAGGRSWWRPTNASAWTPLSETKNDLPFRTLVEPALPDLTVPSLTASAIVTPGGRAFYTWTVQNVGNATANAVNTSPPGPPFVWGDQMWLSTSPTSIAGARPAGGIVAANSLAPGESYTTSFSATIAADVPPGQYFFILQTDSGGQIAEGNEANNLSAGVPVTVARRLVVNSANDADDGACDAAHCSLREAIATANADAAADVIEFAIPGTGTPTVQPASPLPAIATPVVIDGTSQPGGWVVLNGELAGATAIGLRLTGGGSTVRGLVVQRFGQAGIRLAGGGGNTVAGNRIGTTLDGLGLAPNGLSGVAIDGSNDNVVGGTAPADRNLLSGNAFAGVAIGNGAARNSVLGNYIGLGADGRADVRNDRMGVLIEGPSNTVRGNVISGNNLVTPAFDHGVVLSTAGATGNVIAGNLIGPAADGTRGFPNAGAGVLIVNDAGGNTIGGATPQDRNVISGNSNNGIRIGSNAGGNVIRGNYIGLALDGQTALGNGMNGIAMRPDDGAPQGRANTIQDNVIGANNGQGIFVELGAAAHTIAGNVIGLAADGVTARPNANGLYAYLGETPQRAAMDIRGNTVSGNSVHGMYLYGVSAATVAANRIGLATDGTTVRGNGSDGIVLINSSGVTIEDNRISGNAEGIVLGAGDVSNALRRNTVHGNASTGVTFNGAGTTGNTLEAGSITGHAQKGIVVTGGAHAGILPPTITSATITGGLVVRGTAGTTALIQVYADAADEGRYFLGSSLTNELGQWTVASWTYPDMSAIEAALRAGTLVLHATQTMSFGTSEFSDAFRARGTITGVAQYRELSTGGVLTTTILGGATVTLIAPDGTRTRVTAAADGSYTFPGGTGGTRYTVGYDGTAGGRRYITGVRFTTDPSGGANVPPPAAIVASARSWLRAQTLLNGVPVVGQVALRGKAAWYRFPISPQQIVTISLTGCPFPCDLVVYKDLFQVSAALRAAAATQAGIRLSLQGDIMADDLDADDLDADDLDADDLDADDLDADDLDADDLDADGDGLTGFGSTYVAAQRKGLRAASLTPGYAAEQVTINTRDLTGHLYIRVAGGSDIDETFTIVATGARDASCTTAALAPRSPSTTAASLPTNKRTLILTDTAAYGLSGQARTDFLAKLGQLASHPTVDGFVLDLAGDANIQALRADWDAARTCVAQANLVTDAIRQVVAMFRAQNPAENLINAGGDSVIPFRRVADWAEISRESRYNPPVAALTPSEASLAGETFLNDDFYVASAVEGPNRTLYLPEIAVGRLVESPADVSAYVDAYLATGGVASPTSALSSGYDFTIDLAQYVAAQLQARGLAVNASLIGDTWTADDWRTTVLGTSSPFGILSLQGHFSANRLVPADNGQRILSTEIAALTDARFRGALVYSLGCHSGYSIVDADATILTQPLAFPEAFMRQGATVVAGTGYQYGETVLMKNTEALMALLTLELGYSTSPSGASWSSGVPIGAALAAAKRAYMAGTATPRGIDLKVVGVSTVYGSPTMRFVLPSQQQRPVPPSTVTPDPVAGFSGLTSDDVSPSYSLTLNGAAGGPQYYDASGSTTIAPYRPIAPLVTVPAGVNGTVLQGAVFLGGQYVETPFVPRTSIPATELSGEAPRFVNDVFMPIIPLRTNLFGGDAVQIIPFQYRSSPTGTDGTARVFSSVSVRAYWSSRTGSSAAADAPVITDVSLVVNAQNRLEVIATLRGLLDPGIASVYLTYTDESAASRSFASLQMAEIAGTTVLDGAGFPGFKRLYRAEVPGDPLSIRFLVQAVSGNGRVAAATDNGQLYALSSIATPSPTAPVQSHLTLSAPASATYKSAITATATLTSEGAPLAGRYVTFKLGGQMRIAMTNAAGVATATLDATVTPRAAPYPLTAAFPGEPGIIGDAATVEVTVTRAPTTLQVVPGAPQYSDAASVARLVAAGVTLNEQPIVITRGGVSVATATDFAGEARFDTMDFGAGAGPSALRIAYAGNDRYLGATLDVTVGVLAENATLAVAALDPQPTGAVTFSAQVTQAADGSSGDITRAQVRFTFIPATGTPLTATGSVSAAGASTVTVTLPSGLYRVEAQVIGDFTSDVVAITVPVYDPSVFVTGGGWLRTGAAPIGVPAGARATFGFAAKYLADGVTPDGMVLVHVRSAAGKDNDSDAQAAANGSVIVRSTSLDWLVIAGSAAAFTGRATVNGAGGYSFRVDVVDASPDVFVMRVWGPGGSYDSPAYEVRGDLLGGAIRIHR
ncbi:MAG TPA: right-handed parallel beta-helix repeat-containing protein [Candidatus Limnocylindria bacterium]|nr:right-handed parallel beta-helix repeat-containing protein [Candidatus Limnocylindria bacterium]